MLASSWIVVSRDTFATSGLWMGGEEFVVKCPCYPMVRNEG